MDDHTFQTWLDTAVKGIRFGPDRRAARCELAGHLEDRAADLRRIFPDLTDEEARERTLAGMGDAAEIGKQLARVHKPWLGYLWRASQVLLALPLVWLLLFGPQWMWLTDQLGWFDDGPHREPPPDPATLTSFSCADVAAAGPYTLLAEGALEFDPLSARDAGQFQVTLRARSPFFWEEPSISEYWQAEDDQGNFYPSYAQWSDEGILGTQPEQRVYNLNWNRSGLGWTGACSIGGVPADTRWLRLTLDIGDEPITILLEREEGTT